MHFCVAAQKESDFKVGVKLFYVFFFYQNIKAHNYTFSGMKVFHFHGNQNFISDNVKRRKEGKSLAFLLQSFCIS